MPATCYSAFNILNGFSEQQCTYSSGGRGVGVSEGGVCVCACVSQCCLCCLRMQDGKNSACKPFANLHLCFHCDMMRYAGKKLEHILIFCFHDFHDIKLQHARYRLGGLGRGVVLLQEANQRLEACLSNLISILKAKQVQRNQLSLRRKSISCNKAV